MKPIVTLLITALAAASLLLSSCGEASEPAIPDVVIAEAGVESPFQLVFSADLPEEERADILSIRTAIKDACGVTIKPVDDFFEESESSCEIIVNSERREESAELLASLSDGEYAIKTIITADKTSIVIAYRGEYARVCAIRDFIAQYVTAGGKAAVPADLDIRTLSVPEDIVIAEVGSESRFSLVYDTDADETVRREIISIRTAISDAYGVKLELADDEIPSDASDCEIIVGSALRSECKALTDTLQDGEYAIKTVLTADKTSIVIAYKGGQARRDAIEEFIRDYITAGDRAAVPGNLNIKKESISMIINSGIPALRDPCMLVADGVYYLYGTGWQCWKNSSGKLDSGWEGPYKDICVPPEDSSGENHWAPEVHEYKGAYYMFTTYKSKTTGHRGCTILKADNPLGPFVEISDGHLTPEDWDCIDGTFYVDPDGQPWMIFVHEWTSTDDGIGRMAAAKLSDDLTHFISEPVELFRADDPDYTHGRVTDGCWMYTTEKGSLLMIWSNFLDNNGGYMVAIARSESGLVTGPWVHEEQLLFSRAMTGEYDGGHGMIFELDGQTYLSIHSPNSATAERGSMPVFVPIREENDTLVWDK